MMSPVGGESRRAALITGVGRARGIAAAVARRLAPSCDLMLTGHPAYDRARCGDGVEPEIGELIVGLRRFGGRVEYSAADLSQISAPRAVVTRAVEGLGRIDVLVGAHAYSTETRLGSLASEEIDRHLTVNVRATLMLVEAFAERFDSGDDEGRVVLFSSGQRLGPMPDELAYAASKGGVEALVISLTEVLAGKGITVNAVNPGPTDTGWLSGEAWERVRARFPRKRWGEPDDAARLVAWLTSPEAAWVTGQILDSEGGFQRNPPREAGWGR